MLRSHGGHEPEKKVDGSGHLTRFTSRKLG